MYDLACLESFSICLEIIQNAHGWQRYGYDAAVDDDDVNESGDVEDGDDDDADADGDVNEADDVKDGDDDDDDVNEADDVKDGVVKEAEMLRESASTPFTTTILFSILMMMMIKRIMILMIVSI